MVHYGSQDKIKQNKHYNLVDKTTKFVVFILIHPLNVFLEDLYNLILKISQFSDWKL